MTIKPRTILLGLILAASCGGLCILRAAAAPSAASKATSKAASKPTTTSAPAGKRRAKDEVVPKVLVDAAKASFVVVDTWYKKDESDTSDTQRDLVRQTFLEFIEKKCPDQRTGLVIAPGEILVADDGTEDRYIDRIVVRDAAGGEFPAKRSKLLSGAPGILLGVDAAAGAKLKALSYVAIKGPVLDAKLQQAMLVKSDDKWQVDIQPLPPSVLFEPGKVDNLFYGARGVSHTESDLENSPVIVADGNGWPLGVSAASFMDLRQKDYIWQGADLVACPGMTWSDYTAAQEKVRKQWIDAVQEVVVTFRQGGGEDEAAASHSRNGAVGGPEGREGSVYGVAISKQFILIPQALTRDLAASIDKFYVKFSATDRRKAEFVGAYKNAGAFLVRLTKGELPSYISPAAADPAPIKPFLVANARKKFGSKYVDLTCNRLYGKSRGYAGAYHWYAARPLGEGDFLVDFDGRLAGVFMKERQENEEERQIERRQERYGPSQDQQNRVFTISEIRSSLANPQAHLDKEIAVKSRSEAKRRPWLGVEYVPMTSDLAEYFKVEAPTKDGQLGFVVNAVYPDSPAAKFGLKVGDILLKIEAPGLSDPIELVSRQGGEEGDFHGRRGFHLGGEGEDGTEEEMGPVEPAWRSQRSFLNFVLDKIRIGRKITITYYRHNGAGKGELKKIDYTIEQAPLDYDSAPKWKNRSIGFTVKDLTYEIRYALALKNDDPGVIVANIEPGSPARVAKVYVNEIITRLNDVPLTSARQMRDLIAKAHKAGQQKVRLTILRLDKTRFADVAISAYDGAEDEGMDGD